MSKVSKSSPSCFGLFVKSWLLSVLALSCATAAVVALGIRYLSWNALAWTSVSGWSSYPVLTAVAIGSLSTLLAFALAMFLGLASAFLSKGSSKRRGSGSTSRSTPRPQSQRKTTV